MAPRPPQDFGQFGSGAVGGPGAPPRPPYPPRPVAAGLPYPVAATTFTTGSLLNEAFTILFANFVPFTFIAGIILLPMILVNVMVVIAQERVRGDPDAVLMIQAVGMVPALLFLLLLPVATGAISYGVFQQVRGRHVHFAECVSVGFSRLLPVLGVSILAGLAVIAGRVACCIPGMFLAVLLYVAVPAAVVEHPGVMASLNRSVDLTDGFRWPIFGLYFVLGSISFLLELVAGFLAVAGEQFIAVAILAVIIGGAFQIVMAALKATGASLVYYRLRNIKESIDANELASVFD